MSSRRIGVEAASLVCKVDSTMCPVMAARRPVSTVSLSRISPTSTMSGSCRSVERSTVENPRPIFSLTWTWVIPGSRYSIGSSTVTILASGEFIRASAPYSVVVLPEPVGPVNSSMPCPNEMNSHPLARIAAGMLLVTGPTGSGKTTTLYGALARMNSPDAKIVTVEDPIEYRLPGITQVQVNEKIGLGFSTVLRSTLRQDPDIVLVGEMRDKDTVETGLRAAMTGHMVLSTLHTNDAASTPIRLLDMGAPRYLIATSLRLVLSQRLVRAVCTQCTRPYAPTAQESAFLQAFGAAGDAIAKGAGCPQCKGTGFLGRLGAYELLDMTRSVVAALNSADTQAYMDAAHCEIGQLSLANHVCGLVQSGRTTVSEAMRLIGHSHEAG